MKSLKYIIGYLIALTIILLSAWLNWSMVINVDNTAVNQVGWQTNLLFLDMKIPCATLIIFGATLVLLALLEILEIFNVKDWLMLSLFTLLLFMSIYTIGWNAGGVDKIIFQEGVILFIIGIFLLIVTWSVRRINIGAIKSWKEFFIKEV